MYRARGQAVTIDEHGRLVGIFKAAEDLGVCYQHLHLWICRKRTSVKLEKRCKLLHPELLEIRNELYPNATIVLA